MSRRHLGRIERHHAAARRHPVAWWAIITAGLLAFLALAAGACVWLAETLAAGLDSFP